MLEQETRTRTAPTTSDPQPIENLPLAIEIGVLRRRAGLSHDELTQLSGMSPDTAEQIATGAEIPSAYRLHRICNALNMPPKDPRRAALQSMAVDERVRRGPIPQQRGK